MLPGLTQMPMLHSLLDTWDLATMTHGRNSEEEAQIQCLSHCSLKILLSHGCHPSGLSSEILRTINVHSRDESRMNLKMNSAKQRSTRVKEHPEGFQRIPDEPM